MGEKTTLLAITPILAELRKPDATMLQKAAVFQVIGLIAEPCRESFMANIQEQMVILSVGVMDKNIRVKHAALHALGCLMDILAPTIQTKFHTQLAPKLIEFMKEDTCLKMKTQAT